ncbi:MAG: hypothetical protein ABIG92_05840 [Candidatus Omnitrophota bacterium]
MDEELYKELESRKEERYESICRRCGVCCGVLESDPCEHLEKNESNKYFCSIYKDRLGLRKTAKGKHFLCIPIRDAILNKWSDRDKCAYTKEIQRYP